MAIYDYGCTDPVCATVLEKEHKMSEEPIVPCPACGLPMRKLITAPAAVHFKGSCWAKDGYR